MQVNKYELLDFVLNNLFFFCLWAVSNKTQESALELLHSTEIHALGGLN